MERYFPTTIWSAIRGAGEAPDPLNRLCALYWRPVHSFVRLVWRKDPEEAEDLTQSFFAHLLERNPWSRLRPELGSFRNYLRTALRHFLINARSLHPAPLPLEHEPVDRAYDREWFHCLLETSIAELSDRLKPLAFEVFRLYCLEPEPSPTYAELAERFVLRESDVRNFLARARRELREIVRKNIREYVTGDDEIEEELREASGRRMRRGSCIGT